MNNKCQVQIKVKNSSWSLHIEQFFFLTSQKLPLYHNLALYAYYSQTQQL